MRWLSIVLIVLWSTTAESEDKCAASNQYACPYLTDLCNETVFVSDCLADCEGYRNTHQEPAQCFDRKLLNGQDNPDSSYLWRDVLGILVWFCAAGIATACGVGGGGIYVPLGILLLNFAPKPSSGLSQASIFGASLGGLLLNSQNKHPFTTKVVCTSDDQTRMTSIPTKGDQPDNSEDVQYYARPLIDFDMALFLAPMEMAGAVLGVLIQKILPNWLYLTLAAIILGFTAFKTYRKFLDTRRTEKGAAAQQEDDDDDANNSKDSDGNTAAEKTDGSNEAHTLALASDDNESVRFQNRATGRVHSASEMDENNNAADVQMEKHVVTSNVEDPSDQLEPVKNSDTATQEEKESAPTNQTTETAQQANVERCRYWLEKDQRQFPREKLMGLLILWIGLILLTFFKGGKGVDSILGITCASPWYGVLIGIQFAWTFGIAAFYGYRLMKATEDKQACGYPFHPQDVLWDFRKVRFYSFFTFIAGIVAGLIGIGGGMVLGPLMLIMGIHPRVSSATTATMIVLTSSSVAVLFVTAGLVPWEYAITFFCVCFVGAILGKTKIDGYVKRTGKASLLIFLLATIIALATLGCIVIVLTRLAEADWCFAGFNKFCSISDDEGEAGEEVVCSVDRMLFGVLPSN